MEDCGVRALGPALVVSIALLASMAWCFVALRTLTGHDHIHLCARDFGAYLVVIDLAFVAALAWHNHLAAGEE